MAFTDNNNGMYMPVAPMGMGGYGMNNGFGNGFCGDGAWWLLVLFLFCFNNGWGNGYGGNGGGGAVPYILNNGTNADLQRGFDQQAVMNGITGISSSLCSGFAGVNQAITSAAANAEIAANARQIADMQQNFASQTAITAGMNAIQAQQAQCCCDQQLATANLNATILAEGCSNRSVVSDGIRDLLVNNTTNTQRIVDTTTAAVQGIYDKICQLELNAKDERIAELQNQVNNARSDAATLAAIQAMKNDNQTQTQQLMQYLNPPAIPAYVVPNPNAAYYNNGCGCNGTAAYYGNGCCGGVA